jgi:hypothetical protein
MNRTDVPIASPCSADWSTMTLADRGRFCGECKKVVRELARMTESEARAMLASPPTEGLCVRYVHDATGEILFRRDVVPVGSLSRVKRAAALALAAATLPLAVAGCMGAAPVMGAAPPVSPDPAMMGAVTMGAPPPPEPTTAPTPSSTPAPAPTPAPALLPR